MARKSMDELLGGVTRFGRLAVLDEAPPYEWRPGKYYRLVNCQCDCGTMRVCQPSKLRTGQTVSCGCYAAENASKRLKRHGMTTTPEYVTWRSMRDRCSNPAATGYHSYGGRGIKVCDRWLESFEAFYADMGRRPDGMSIDRIDVNGNYEPGNCRWATTYEQGDNRTDNHHIEVAGERINLSEARRRSGLTQSSIRARMRKGMTPEQAVTSPRDKSMGSRHKSNNRYIVYGGKRMLMCELTDATGVKSSHLDYHLRQGRLVDDAVAFILVAKAADKTKCPQGHSLSGDNLYVDPRGTSQCRSCRKAARLRANSKNNLAAPSV
jgi:hypothetical protein